MQIEVLDSKTLSLSDIMSDADDIYCIYKKNDNMTIYPLGSYSINNVAKCEDYLIVRILTEDKEIELPPPVDKTRDKPTRSYERRTYKFDGSDKDEVVFDVWLYHKSSA